jgi:hypothetical protein
MFHVKWVLCAYGISSSHVSVRGDGLQLWRMTANMLNKASRAGDEK